MPNQLRTVNFGSAKSNLTGSTGVGFRILNNDGTVATARTTTGVYQLVSGSGIYSAYAFFSSSFHGNILWDTGEVPAIYAADEYNYEACNPNVDTILTTLLQVSSSVDFNRKINEGRWQIFNNQMIFYAQDNTTEIVRFNLFDQTGTPASQFVTERKKV
jgi:hypothetical protein